MELMSHTYMTDRFIMAHYIYSPTPLACRLKKKKSVTIKVVTFPRTYC